MTASKPDLAADVLFGAGEIAEFLFGDRKERRVVYRLAFSLRLPVFVIGAALCARRSVLANWTGTPPR